MAFVGICIPSNIAHSLGNIEVPGKKEAQSEQHITILYFGENWPVEQAAKSLETIFRVTSKTDPFLITIKKVDYFPVEKGKPYPIIAKVESKELHDLNEKLKEEFDKDGIDYSKLHKTYNPHITLAYSEESIEEFKIRPLIQFSVNELVLWCGDHGNDRLFVTFPFKSTEKHSFIINKTKLFYKLAKHMPESLFSRSVERRKN